MGAGVEGKRGAILTDTSFSSFFTISVKDPDFCCQRFVPIVGRLAEAAFFVHWRVGDLLYNLHKNRHEMTVLIVPGDKL
jgi:hypothetical protein